MHASWKIASSALLSLVLAGAAGCATGGEDPAGDGPSLAAAEADVAPNAPPPPADPGHDVVIVNINSNDHLGFHHGGHGGGGHGGHHHGCGNGAAAATAPLAPPPPVPPPPPPEHGQPG